MIRRTSAAARIVLMALSCLASHATGSNFPTFPGPDPRYFDSEIEVSEVSASLPDRPNYPLLGATVELSITTQPGDVVSWRHDGIVIPDANSSTLRIANLSPADGGNYTVTIVRDVIERTSATLPLNIARAPVGSVVDPMFTADFGSANAVTWVAPTVRRFDGAFSTSFAIIPFHSVARAWVTADGSSRDVYYNRTPSDLPPFSVLGEYADGSVLTRQGASVTLKHHDGSITDLSAAESLFPNPNAIFKSSTDTWLLTDGINVTALDAIGTVTHTHAVGDYGVFTISSLLDAGPSDDRVVLIGRNEIAPDVYQDEALLLEADGHVVDGFEPIFFDRVPPTRLANHRWMQISGTTLRHFDELGRLTRTIELNPALKNRSATIAPDGRIYIFLNDLGISRLDAEGQPDPNYVLSVAPETLFSSMIFEPDGRVVVGGTFNLIGGHATSSLARLLADATVTGASPIIAVSADARAAKGQPMTLRGVAVGNGPFTYEWISLDGAELPAVTNEPTLHIDAMTTAHLGVYQLRVSNAHGSALSEVIDLRAQYDPRIANISGRGSVLADSRPLVAGFVLDPRWHYGSYLMLRGVGPTLSTFNVAEHLPNPELKLTSLAGDLIEANDDWAPITNSLEAAIAQSAGAFPLADGSADAQILRQLGSGAYTATLTGRTNEPGVALVEVFALRTGVANLSLRGHVGAGDDVLIGGFIIDDPEQFDRPLRVLIRAIGPGLAKFDVPGGCADPKITLFDGKGNVLSVNSGWTTTDIEALQAAAQTVGAFALEENSADSALLITLPPGNYTAHVGSISGFGGTALLEIYRLP